MTVKELSVADYRNIEKINIINDQMSFIDKETIELKDYTKNINNILNIINSVSEQTNLLAFKIKRLKFMCYCETKL